MRGDFVSSHILVYQFNFLATKKEVNQMSSQKETIKEVVKELSTAKASLAKAKAKASTVDKALAAKVERAETATSEASTHISDRTSNG